MIMNLKKLFTNLTEARTQGATMDKKLRTTISKDLAAVGMDGNGKFERPMRAWEQVVEILNKYNIEPQFIGDIGRQIDPYQSKQGHLFIRLAFKVGEGDEREDIGNASLTFTWYERSKYNFEVLSFIA
jgi:hypothetical protein